MGNTTKTRQVWAAYKSPRPDVPGSVEIGVNFVTARATPKLCLIAILLCAVSALSASPAGVARVNGNQRNSSQLRLILQEQTQLGEGPGMQNGSLLSPNRNPTGDAFEFFNCDPTFGAFSFGNNLLTDVVVCPGSEPSLTPGKIFKFPLGRSGPLTLELRPELAVAVAHGFNGRPAVNSPVGIGGNVVYPQIDSEKISGRNGGIFGEIHGAVQVELPLAINQVSLPLDSVEPLPLVLSVDQRQDHAALGHGPDANFVHPPKSHDAFIIGDRAVWFERRTDRLIPLEALYGLTNSTNGHLCGQSKAISDFPVGQFVNARLREDLGFKPAFRRKCSGLIVLLHRQQEPLALFSVGQELELESQFHCVEYISPKATSQEEKGGNAIPPPPEGDGLLAKNS